MSNITVEFPTSIVTATLSNQYEDVVQLDFFHLLQVQRFHISNIKYFREKYH